jgi:hypothetical protein
MVSIWLMTRRKALARSRRDRFAGHEVRRPSGAGLLARHHGAAQASRIDDCRV